MTMYRIVSLERVGVYVVMNQGAMATLGGKSHWTSLDALRHAAKLENAPLYERVLRTRD